MPNVNLTWDPMPEDEVWEEVRIYESNSLVASVPVPATSVTFPVEKGSHTFTARSWDGLWESDDSNSVTLKAPMPPGHLRRL